MPQNAEAVAIYMLCHKQLILSGMGGPIDINHLAVHKAIDLYGVDDPVGCFEKVIKVAGHMLARWEALRKEKEDQGQDG